MGKRIPTPPPIETVTIPKASFDAIFRTLEEMKNEIAGLRARLEEMPKPEIVLNSTEAALRMGVTRQTICAWARQKKIHRVERAGKRGFLATELDKIKAI